MRPPVNVIDRMGDGNMTENNGKKNSFLKTGIAITAFAILFYTLLHDPGVYGGILAKIWSYVSPVVLGMCIAFVMNVLLVNIEKLLGFISKGKLTRGISRGLGIVITILIMLGAVVLIMWGIFPAIGDMISQLASYLPGSADSMSEWLSELLARMGVSGESISSLQGHIDDIVTQLLDVLRREYMEIADFALNITTSLFDLVMGAVLSLIFAIYVLAGKESIARFLKAALERYTAPARCRRILKICSLSYSSFNNFVKGQLLEAVILGVLCFIGMIIFGFPYAAVVSLLIGVTALIPIMGAWIGAGISALLILIVSPLEALLFLVFILVLQQLEGNLIYPRVVGQSLGLPGLIVLAAVTVGGNIAGIPGMLLGVPLCAVLYALMKQDIFTKKKTEE